MFETTRGTPVPARWRLLALIFALVAAGEACRDADLQLTDEERDRAGVARDQQGLHRLPRWPKAIHDFPDSRAVG